MEVIPASFLSNLPTNFSVKATLFKVVEVKYTKDGLDFGAVLKKGPIKATVDSKGNVKFTGNIKSISLEGDPVLKALGARFKFLTVTFSAAENGDIQYRVKVSVHEAGDITFRGQFDLEKMLLDRGLLKRAYQPLKNREQQIKNAIDRSLGNDQ